MFHAHKCHQVNLLLFLQILFRKLNGITFRRYHLTVQANAVCVDLLVWAAVDEATAESVLYRLADKIHSRDGNNLIVAHLPLLLVCLRGLGRLADKFPSLSSLVIGHLRDFLVIPSPILLQLHRQSQNVVAAGSNRQMISVNGVAAHDDQMEGLSVAQDAFEQLRETSIDNLCIALKSAVKVCWLSLSVSEFLY